MISRGGWEDLQKLMRSMGDGRQLLDELADSGLPPEQMKASRAQLVAGLEKCERTIVGLILAGA